MNLRRSDTLLRRNRSGRVSASSLARSSAVFAGAIEATDGEAVAADGSVVLDFVAASMALLLFLSSIFCIRSIASFSARGNSGAGSPNFVPALSPPMRCSSKMHCLRQRKCLLPELVPDLGGRLRQDGINQSGNDANSLGRRGQHARLQRNMLRLRAVGGPLPGSIGGQVAVSLRHQGPKPLSASEKFSSSNAGPKAAMR